MLRGMANHGMFVRYYHDYIGVNSRLDSIQAAVLNIKLPRLDDYARARNLSAEYYDKAFAGNPFLKIPERFAKSTHVFHQYTLITENIDRNGLIAHLASKEIPAMIYYPVPLHLQKAYQDPRYKEGDFPVTERLSDRVLSLPMHTELDEEQLAWITRSVLEYLNQQ